MDLAVVAGAAEEGVHGDHHDGSKRTEHLMPPGAIALARVDAQEQGRAEDAKEHPELPRNDHVPGIGAATVRENKTQDHKRSGTHEDVRPKRPLRGVLAQARLHRDGEGHANEKEKDRKNHIDVGHQIPTGVGVEGPPGETLGTIQVVHKNHYGKGDATEDVNGLDAGNGRFSSSVDGYMLRTREGRYAHDTSHDRNG